MDSTVDSDKSQTPLSKLKIKLSDIESGHRALRDELALAYKSIEDKKRAEQDLITRLTELEKCNAALVKGNAAMIAQNAALRSTQINTDSILNAALGRIKSVEQIAKDKSRALVQTNSAHDAAKKEIFALQSTLQVQNKTLEGKDENIRSLIAKNKTRRSEIGALRIKIAAFKSEIKEQKANVVLLQRSKSYRIGHLLVLAVKRPGMNTIALPYRLMRVILGKV